MSIKHTVAGAYHRTRNKAGQAANHRRSRIKATPVDREDDRFLSQVIVETEADILKKLNNENFGFQMPKRAYPSVERVREELEAEKDNQFQANKLQWIGDPASLLNYFAGWTKTGKFTGTNEDDMPRFCTADGIAAIEELLSGDTPRMRNRSSINVKGHGGLADRFRAPSHRGAVDVVTEALGAYVIEPMVEEAESGEGVDMTAAEERASNAAVLMNEYHFELGRRLAEGSGGVKGLKRVVHTRRAEVRNRQLNSVMRKRSGKKGLLGNLVSKLADAWVTSMNEEDMTDVEENFGRKAAAAAAD